MGVGGCLLLLSAEEGRQPPIPPKVQKLWKPLSSPQSAPPSQQGKGREGFAPFFMIMAFAMRDSDNGDNDDDDDDGVGEYDTAVSKGWHKCWQKTTNS